MSYNALNHYGFVFKDNKYVRMRFGQYFELITKKLSQKEKIDILDVGGYMGDLYEFIKTQKISTDKISYTIIDYDDSAMRIAKSRGINTHKMDFNFQDIRDVIQEKKFDIIICTEVLEHLLDPKKHIKSFTKVMKSNGICIISLPNENTIFHRIYSLSGMGIDQCVFELYKHLHFPTIKQSRNFVSKYFDIVEKEYYINMGGKGSRLSWVGKIFAIIPDSFWQFLANRFPGLFARGIIFRLELKNKSGN